MSTIWEETKKQGSKMKDRPLKEKIAYFWEYYHVQVLIGAGALAIVISIIHAIATSRDYALSVVMINSIASSMTEVTDVWTSDLSELIEFDPKKYEVYIDSTIMLGSDRATANEEYASQQKMAALISSASIDILISDSEQFERYAQNNSFADLRTVYSESELKAFEGRIYYTDRNTFKDYESDANINVDINALQASYTVDHRDPSSMADPVPVGIYASGNTKIGNAGVYSHYTADDTYQGQPIEAVIGIPTNSPRIPAAVTGIDYFLN